MPRESTTLQIGSTAPDFTLNDSAGSAWRLRDHLPAALFFLRGTV